MDSRPPSFWRNLREELVAGHQWIDRAVVLIFAVLTGLVVVGFTLLSEAASYGFEHVRTLGQLGPWLTLVWTPWMPARTAARQFAVASP